MDCKAFRQESEELETGERISAAAQAHLNSCMACRTFQAERLSLRQLIGSLGPVNAPPDFDFRLRARLATAKSEGNGYFRFAPSLKAISVAASFALLITAAVVYRQFQPGQISPTFSSVNQAIANGTDEGQRLSSSNSQPRAIAGADVQPQPVNSNGLPVLTGGKSQSGVDDKVAIARTPRNNSVVKSNRPAILDNEASVRGNPRVIMPVQPSVINSSGGDATASLRVPSQPVKLMLHDKQGAMRSISLEPVMFGSQDFLERAARLHNSGTDVEGIW